jgi:quercetin dioxygenase-like cupin family protein
MITERIFKSSQFMQPTDECDPIRSVVTQTTDATVVAWYVKPGQKIRAHRHPNGQDTWTILSGEGNYIVDLHGSTRRIFAGDVVIAKTKEVHGVHNTGEEPLVFISVVSPAEAGYELLDS